MASMLLAVEVYLWLRRRGWIDRADVNEGGKPSCLICDYKEGPDYPVEQPEGSQP